MKKIPKGKKALYVYIDEDIYNKLKKYVKLCFDNAHGALSAVVQDAIASFLMHTGIDMVSAHTIHKLANPRLPRCHVYAQQIINYLRDRGCSVTCSVKDLKEAIINTRGSDPRTIRKWMRFLVENGYMKWIASRVLEIV